MADTDQEVKLNNVRISFADLFEAQPFGDGTEGAPRFSVNLLLPKNTDEGKAQIEKVRAAMLATLKAKWPVDPPRLPADKKCLKDGEPLDEETGEPKGIYEGYDGMMFLTASSSEDRPPKVIDSRRGPDGKFPILTAKDGRPYSGCYCNVIVRIWAQDNKYGKRINAEMLAVQFAGHGEAFTARRDIDVDSAFDDMGGEDGFDDVGGDSQVEDELV